MVAVDDTLCLACARCVPFCPTDALRAVGALEIDAEKCTDCLECIPNCPVGALKASEQTDENQKGITLYRTKRGEQYDTIVIGSGIGGLCVAALLTHGGYRTLVLESLPDIGGRCSTLDYRGFKLYTGAFGIPLGTSIEQVFKQVGAEFDIVPATSVVWTIYGKNYNLPKKGGLRWLLSQLGTEADVEGVMGALSLAMGWKKPSGSISFRDWLIQYTQNEKILAVFQTLITSLMTINSWELPADIAVETIAASREYRSLGFARGGSVTLMRSLATYIQDHGGDIWTCALAKEILVTDAMAKGVIVVREGKETEIPAAVIISDVGPTKTIELTGEENFERGFLKEVKETIRPAAAIGLEVAIHSPVINHSGLQPIAGARRVNMTVVPTIFCPELAPKGTHLLVAGSTPLSSLPPFDLKKELELCIMDLSDLFPEFNQSGEILQHICFHGNWPVLRAWPGYQLPEDKTPVKGLYLVGDGASPRGTTGTEGAAKSAQIVAEDIKKRFRPMAGKGS